MQGSMFSSDYENVATHKAIIAMTWMHVLTKGGLH
jgi:hypothetical protein